MFVEYINFGGHPYHMRPKHNILNFEKTIYFPISQLADLIITRVFTIETK